MSPYSGLRNIILIGSLFGFHGLLNRSLLIDGVDEIYIVTSRITIVTLILFLYCFKEFKSQINFNTLLKGSWTGFLAIFIPGWTFIYALKNISSGLQSIFISTIPMFTVFWVFFFYKEEKITKLKISSVAVGLLGLVALFSSGVTGLSDGGNLLIGGLLALIGVQGLAISNITNKKDSQLIPAKTYLLTQWLAATFISVVIFILLGGEIVHLSQSETLKLLGLVFIDIFNYSLFFYTIKRLSATFTTLVDYVVPIVGIIVGYIFLGEVISNIFFVTLTMIFISLYLAVKDEINISG
ncbi:MAG: DMT family transporter [Candidatus Actinomarina sp.]|jgi:drug/metabolite transporter (DMT)-like permease|nr:DMT family transporter [Candidatus Actinomarina sp.]|tara:strand:+ start:693 stop:1580 length:888 start_codon:yes stop_codon:yes gene_type:complete